ncbi:MAG TPA: chitobiase/beta-hexosaminidase C-terminal domain-containing protein, partial [Polyangiaceae bacterium]|nr:chitobiase/beta-hexosaminidase C-terminal domain-containing protein [Polyangiaceae bacterium]
MIPSVGKALESAVGVGLAVTAFSVTGLCGCDSGPPPVALEVADTNVLATTPEPGQSEPGESPPGATPNPSPAGETGSSDTGGTAGETPANPALAPPSAPVDGAAGSAAPDSTTGVEPSTEPEGTAPSGDGCWSLPVITRARLFPAPGHAAELVGAKIVGSTRSAMNDFVDLGVIRSAPAEGAWIELPLTNAAAYRYVKYFSAPGSHGALAEVEFYAGNERLAGEAFGTAGSLDDAGNTFERALDADTATYFEGPLPNDSYVGLDLAAGHVALAPRFSPPPGEYALAPNVALAAEAGAELVYTLDGSDPAVSGLPYTGPLALPAQPTLLRALARRSCALPSEITQGIFRVPSPAAEPGSPPPPVQSSLHIGNSLTDTIVDDLEPLAQSGGVLLDFNRYTIPGAGTWMYADNPTGGFGVADVQLELKSRPFDHLSVQPFPNEPCQIAATSAGPDSDSGFIAQAWADARSQNPDVQLWVYQQWPDPVDYTNCITGGGWLRSDEAQECQSGGSLPECWEPSEPEDWDAAVQNELAYDEAIVEQLMQLE